MDLNAQWPPPAPPPLLGLPNQPWDWESHRRGSAHGCGLGLSALLHHEIAGSAGSTPAQPLPSLRHQEPRTRPLPWDSTLSLAWGWGGEGSDRAEDKRTRTPCDVGTRGPERNHRFWSRPQQQGLNSSSRPGLETVAARAAPETRDLEASPEGKDCALQGLRRVWPPPRAEELSRIDLGSGRASGVLHLHGAGGGGAGVQWEGPGTFQSC